ncbi:MAG TPA: hypothetical protein VLL25_13775, partial [Acidimicrobiales bacterium]|nr:hypothetical protein [Acidimicrobiales bacterium]
MHELELGGAAVCSATPASVVGAVQTFLADRQGGSLEPTAHDALTAAAWDEELLDALGRAGVKLELSG